MDTALFVLATVSWLIFLTAFGLCIGSFLNVIAYRLPLGQSIWAPRWSACPECGHVIRWHDNIPVLGFLVLRGRCRDCGCRISPRYPIIELLTALVMLLIFGAFFIAQSRRGIAPQTSLITWQIGHDWPIFLAHVILFAALLAMSAIDLEHYWVDVRFTHLATLAGFVMHMLWTPTSSAGWHRPWDSTAAACVAALAGLCATFVVVHIMFALSPEEEAELAPANDASDQADAALAKVPSSECRDPLVDEASDEAGPARKEVQSAESRAQPDDEASNEVGPARREVQSSKFNDQPVNETPDATGVEPAPVSPKARRRGLMAVAMLSLLLIVTLAAILAGSFELIGGFAFASVGLAALAGMFLLILGAAVDERPSDHEIVQAIEAERFSARSVAAEELLLLIPAILCGALAFAAWRSGWLSPMAAGRLIHWAPGGDWQPVWGFATAASGFVIGGAIGWAVRIFFTLLLGKEAFGVGDIHMMAAAGCVAGWPVVLLGFFAAVFLALAAWLLSLPFKRTRAIPLGPWLSLGFLLVVLFYDQIIAIPIVSNVVSTVQYFLNIGDDAPLI